MSKPLKIAMVSFHGCIRVYKEMVGLKTLGHEVILITQQLPMTWPFFDYTIPYHDTAGLIRALQAVDADVYHVHNEPDSLVLTTREAMPHKPIVFDVHDMESLRWPTPPGQEEIDAFAAADALIHVSEPIREEAHKAHGAGKPDEVIYSWQTKEHIARDVDIIPDPSFRSLVYEGGVAIQDPISKGDGTQSVNIRDFRPIFHAFRSQGYAVNIIGAQTVNRMDYEDFGCFKTPPVIYPAMLAALRPHGIGFVGASGSAKLMELAMPNKLFEYMSQGVVPVCLNAQEAGRFVTTNDCGIVLDNLDNLGEQLKEAPEKRKNVLSIRKELIQEKQAEKIDCLYREIL